ncbi:MAG: hypothetical protein EOO07_07655 [Chitinophagaceae bacterium]|nr:MAG: hypothetical protein EOO07_07655 [Chitinophagaceae bacterium]
MVKREGSKTMKLLRILLAMLMSCHLSCSLRKTRVDQTAVWQKQEIIEESATGAVFETNTVARDSLNSILLLQIKPKGVFSFSMKHGFVGEAEELRIESTKVKGKTLEIAEKLTIDHTVRHIDKSDRVAKTVAKEVERKSSSSIWIFLLLIILILCFIFRRIFRAFWK